MIHYQAVIFMELLLEYEIEIDIIIDVLEVNFILLLLGRVLLALLSHQSRFLVELLVEVEVKRLLFINRHLVELSCKNGLKEELKGNRDSKLCFYFSFILVIFFVLKYNLLYYLT